MAIAGGDDAVRLDMNREGFTPDVFPGGEDIESAPVVEVL